MANLDEIQIKISQDSSGASKAIDSLISSLEKLSKSSDIGASANQIRDLSGSLKTLSSVSKKMDMGNVADQIRGIPDAIKGLGELPISQVQSFTNTVRTLSDALEPLATQANAINLMTFSLSSFSPTSKQAADASKNLKKENNELADSFLRVGSAVGSGLKKIAGWGIGIGTIGRYIKDSVTLASKYTQTVNMLNTVMGDGAEEAKEFAENLGNTLGLNPADVMNFQATFQNLFVGFGNESKQAQIMSKNLTQLSYDMAAFYEQLGGDPQAAAEKLRLAMAGTIEPIQRLGYAIKEADLQAVAARQGLNVNIRNLNTASKSMLRYIAVMEQSEHVQGYMARSFDSPTTAMMVFQSAVKQLSTEIGKTFLPMLMAAIPYIYAFITGVLNMVKTINGILGIELPEIKGWDKTKNEIGSIGDEAENTGKKIQKAFTLGIDELNVLDSSANSAGEGFMDISKYLKLPEYNMLEGFSGEKIKEIEEKLKPLEPLFEGMAVAFAGFYEAISGFVDTTLYPWLVSIGEWMKENPETMEALGKGLAYVAIGLLLIKGVGALAKVLMIPELISGLTTVHGWLDKHNIGWQNIFKSMGYVFSAAIILYGAYKLLDNAMNLILNIGDPFTSSREGAAGLAYVIGGVLLAAFIAVGGWTLALGSLIALTTGYIIDNFDDISYSIWKSGLNTYHSIFNWVADLYKKWSIFVAELRLQWELALNNMNGTLLKFVKDILLNLNPIIGAIAELTGVSSHIDNWIQEITLSEEEAKNEKNIKRDVMEDLMIDLKGWEKAEKAMSEYMGTYQNALDEGYKNYKSQQEQDQKEKESISFTDKASAIFSGEFDKFATEQTTELKTGFENIQTELEGQITEGFNNIQLPSFATEDFTKTQEEVVDKTDKTNETLSDNNTLQSEANELLSSFNTLQTEFNTSSLENDEEMNKALGVMNTLQKTTADDISTIVNNVGSDVVVALNEVEDACRNIKIEVHKHYGGGDGYASGGFPTSGEMFFAREDGLPEMVGRVGRQTAVMNNGQIADTMAQSLIRAMGQSGATSQPQVIENKLYLDGEVVYANQQKIQRSKGYNLGMGVFANV